MKRSTIRRMTIFRNQTYSKLRRYVDLLFFPISLFTLRYLSANQCVNAIIVVCFIVFIYQNAANYNRCKKTNYKRNKNHHKLLYSFVFCNECLRSFRAEQQILHVLEHFLPSNQVHNIVRRLRLFDCMFAFSYALLHLVQAIYQSVVVSYKSHFKNSSIGMSSSNVKRDQNRKSGSIIPLEIASKIKPAIWQSTKNKITAYKVHLSFFDIGLGLTPEAAWICLDKQIKPITITAMRRFIYSPFLLLE